MGVTPTRANQSMIWLPVAFQTPAWVQIWPSTSSRCRMRQGWPMIQGCRWSTIIRPVVAPLWMRDAATSAALAEAALRAAEL